MITQRKEQRSIASQSRPSFGVPLSSSGSRSAEDTLNMVYQRQLDSFNRYQVPQIAELESQLTDTSIVDAAKTAASQLGSRVRGATNRRVGASTSGLLPSQRASLDRNIKRGVAKGMGSMVTSANEAQRSKRVSVRQNLLRIGEQLTNTGTASVAQIAQDQTARDARNKASKRSFMSQTLGIAGTVIGGIYGGGPAGAAAGGAIGTSIGGML